MQARLVVVVLLLLSGLAVAQEARAPLRGAPARGADDALLSDSRRSALLVERQDLLLNRPNVALTAVGLGLTVVGGTTSGILLGIDPQNAAIWASLLVVDVLCLVVDVVFLGIGISRKNAADERLAEIDRLLLGT